MDSLKKKILQILKAAENGGIITREIFELYRGGVPMCILANEAQKSLKEIQGAIFELIDEGSVILNPLEKPNKFVQLNNDVKKELKKQVEKIEIFASCIVTRNPQNG